MNLEKLTAIAVTVVMLAATTGQLPKLIITIRKAQAQLVQETKASNWGIPMLLKESR